MIKPFNQNAPVPTNEAAPPLLPVPYSVTLAFTSLELTSIRFEVWEKHSNKSVEYLLLCSFSFAEIIGRVHNYVSILQSTADARISEISPGSENFPENQRFLSKIITSIKRLSQRSVILPRVRGRPRGF